VWSNSPHALMITGGAAVSKWPPRGAYAAASTALTWAKLGLVAVLPSG
jgi:hypothetical protein